MANAKQVMEFRKRRKQLLIDVMGGKCCLCNYNKCNAALEFHHISPEEKSYGLSSSGNCHSLEKDLAEAQKCILVCANCHREIHNGNYDDVIFTTTYQFEVGNVLLQQKREKEEKAMQINKCVDCGIEINKKSIRCVKCESTHRKANNILPVLRDELKSLIRNLSFTQIGQKFNVSDNAIRKWCDSYNLPRRISDIKKFTDKEWELI